MGREAPDAQEGACRELQRLAGLLEAKAQQVATLKSLGIR